MPVRVFAAVVSRDGAYLVGQRPAQKRHGGLWEFPGGKLEEGEDLLEAARRELREELAVDVLSVGSVAFSCQDPGSPFVVEFCFTEIRGEPVSSEHAGLRWLDLPALAGLSLAPSDAAFVRWLAQQVT